MSSRAWPSRVAWWTAVFALVLKAAVPMIAAAAAQWRGVAVAEVCALYGVARAATVDAHAGHAHHDANGAGHHDDGSHAIAAHTGDHCALTAVAWLAPPVAGSTLAVAPAHAAALRQAGAPAHDRRDACAAWVAQRQHGPPSLA